MVASGVWAGEIPLEKAHNLKEVGGNRRTIKQELERIGYLGKKDASHHAMPLAVRYHVHLLLTITYITRLISSCTLVGIFSFVKAIPMGNLLKLSKLGK